MTQLFSLDDNGQLTYSETVIEDGSLFGVTEDSMIQEDINAINEVSSGENVLLNEGETYEGDNTDSGSSGDIITYNVYAVPSDSTGYPNSSSLSYLEDVVKGYPLDYDYVAFRTNSTYAQSMILYVGPGASGSGNAIHFDKCDVVELIYHYESYNNSFLERNYYQDTNVDITLSQNTLAYTNALPGYATFDNTMEDNKFGMLLAGALILAAATFIISRILGGIKHV